MTDLSFFGLLDYIEYKEEHPTEYLYKLLNNPQYLNDHSFDLINYERLITIEYLYPEDEEVQLLIKKIKKIISENYIQKQKMLIRLTSI